MWSSSEGGRRGVRTILAVDDSATGRQMVHFMLTGCPATKEWKRRTGGEGHDQDSLFANGGDARRFQVLLKAARP